MPDSSLSFVAALLDRSGSMSSIADDTRGGFDTFIDAERGHDGTTAVTLAQFDDQYAMVYDSTPIDQVPPLYLVPRGMTALYDAVGKFVTEIGSSLALDRLFARRSPLSASTETPARNPGTTCSMRHHGDSHSGGSGDLNA